LENQQPSTLKEKGNQWGKDSIGERTLKFSNQYPLGQKKPGWAPRKKNCVARKRGKKRKSSEVQKEQGLGSLEMILRRGSARGKQRKKKWSAANSGEGMEGKESTQKIDGGVRQKARRLGWGSGSGKKKGIGKIQEKGKGEKNEKAS